ncbi:hypothetical protein [Actinopolymorpha pittospori]|uniref:Uncharacterized protein n=1 Tax=Actinopolymorpha pittospori TaxID=648752 RepID=A0A927MNJ8_9ACTN|nr:hypothetical protein [Actinopolymorpha pittospori]MBE1603521.1 hypothetical protein [Actinopolymorpha pittospori]
MSDTPLYDQLINERLGRGPSEFDGHDTWDESEEAKAAYARGVAQARAQAQVEARAQAREHPGRQMPAEGVSRLAGRRTR